MIQPKTIRWVDEKDAKDQNRTKNRFTQLKKEMLLLNTVIDSMKQRQEGYTPKQIRDANRARRLCHIIQAPNAKTFRALIRSNMIENNPITIEQAILAEKIFTDKDRSTLKGTSRRRQPKRVEPSVISIPPELMSKIDNMVLCIDTMKVNGIPFLTCIDRTVRYRLAMPLHSTTDKSYYLAIKRITGFYEASGYGVRMILADMEFDSLRPDVESKLKVQLNCSNKDDHVQEAERNIQTIKGRVRII